MLEQFQVSGLVMFCHFAEERLAMWFRGHTDGAGIAGLTVSRAQHTP
jgi:hypothetical protein